jgi:hypothetical protein
MAFVMLRNVFNALGMKGEPASIAAVLGLVDFFALFDYPSTLRTSESVNIIF